METNKTRMGSIEIELSNIGTVQLKLPITDTKELMDFIKTLSNSQPRPHTYNGTKVIRPPALETHRPVLTPTSEEPGNRETERTKPESPKVVERRQVVEGRIETLEEKIASLIDMNKQLVDSLNQDKEEREPRKPSAGTKYHEVLQELVERFGNETFEGNKVSDEKRHVLSILHNKYNAIQVVETRGRTNIYQIRKEIMQSVLSKDGVSNIVEIRGKDRNSCDAFLDTNQKRYPGFTYAFLEGNGLRQRYRLFFKDNSVQLSVTSNLGRFVGNNTNLIVREA